MQAAKPCPQEEPLKEVLLKLGFKESELTNLHNMEDVLWRLNLQSSEPFDSFSIVFAWFFGGSCSPLLGRC